MINSFWHIQRMKGSIIFTSLSLFFLLLLLLHLRRGNQMEYILEKERREKREREEMDACRAFATTEMR
jgi:hypothetical protein